MMPHLMTNDEIESAARALLSELALRRHFTDCDRIEVRFAGAAEEALSFAPKTRPAAPDQAQWERDALGHWRALVPDLDTVTIVVRSYGRIVCTRVLSPDAAPATSDSAAARQPIRPQA